MVGPTSSSSYVVVGIDGSRAAMQAVRWAVDEAVDREIPLWLLYALDDGEDTDAAETAVRSAITEVESLGKAVTLEADIVHRQPVAALVEASRSAAVVCVGSIGFKHATCGRIGSTASALVAAAHCPVAVVPRSAHCTPPGAGVVLAVVDGSSAGDLVLERGADEARLRSAPLHVFLWRPTPTGNGDTPLERRVGAELEHRLSHWRTIQPDIEVVRDHNGLLNYLEHLQRNTTPLRLIVVDPRRPGPLEVLSGPAGRAAMEAAGCAMMVCDRARRL